MGSTIMFAGWYYSASQKAVTAYFSGSQLLHIGFVQQYGSYSDHVTLSHRKIGARRVTFTALNKAKMQ